jgi:hypothetical protein
LIYFFALIIIGQKIILNLFLAILLESFDVDSLSNELNKGLFAGGSTEAEKDWYEKVCDLFSVICYKKTRRNSSATNLVGTIPITPKNAHRKGAGEV